MIFLVSYNSLVWNELHIYYHKALKQFVYFLARRNAESFCGGLYRLLYPHLWSALQRHLLVDFFFRWVTPRAVSAWHSCTWTMHHTPGTSLWGRRSLVLGIYSCTVLSGETKRSFTGYDSRCWPIHIMHVHVQLVQDERWQHDLLSTHQRQSCQAWIAVQMGRSGLNPWFLAPGPPEWHGGQICYLWTKKSRG